ncbi:MAG: tetratricopeptide repeat protein [Bacteroidales bacterium]|nr:tetratricopeptide repeat protein [Bacteroidales bacterium]
MKALAHRIGSVVAFLGLALYGYCNNTVLLSRDNLLIDSDRDSLKLNTIFDSAKYYIRVEPVLSKNLLQKLIMVAEQTHNPRLHEYYNLYGTANIYIGDFEEAKTYYLRALKINQQSKDSIQQIRLHNNLGYAYSLTGNYELALYHYHIGLAMLEIMLQNHTLPSHLVPIGNKTPHQVLALFYGFIGEIHVKIGNFNDAIKNYTRALAFAEKDDNKFYYAGYLNDLAKLYIEVKEYDKALEYCSQAIETNKKIDNQLGIGINYQILGEIYARKDKIENAEIYLDKGLELIESEEDLPSKANALFSKIRIQLKTKQFTQAQNNLDECLDIAHSTGNLATLKDYHYYQFQLDSSRGNIENAFKNFMNYHNLNVALFDIQKNKRIAELQMVYESQKKEKELELLSKENEVQRIKINKSRNIIYFIVGLFSLILIIGYLLMQFQKLRIKHKVVELKQKNLNQQMNPHFVYNCLNSIQSYIFHNDIHRSVDYLSKFAKLMRKILQSSQNEYMSIHDETELLTLYLELESMRFKGKFDYTIRVDDKIDPYDYKIPTLLVQPFVENSLWHGIQNKTGKGHIDIEFRLNNDLLFCSIEDDGIGRGNAALIKNEYQKNHHSLGTHITQDRMRLLRELYGKKLDIKYIDLTNRFNTPAGTRVEINLPIIIN